MLLRDLEASPLLPPSSPRIVKDDVGIPADAFHVMTMVGSDNNPHLLLSACLADTTYTQSIPEVMELIPNEYRVPWTDYGPLPY